MHLARSTEPFLEWQMSKSTGHCLTKKAKRSIVLHSSHDDRHYGDNSRLTYTFYTRCGDDALPELQHLASCRGQGFVQGWAFEDACRQKADRKLLVACDNGTHAWWKAKDLFRDISEDTTKQQFHESLYELESWQPEMPLQASLVGKTTLSMNKHH